MENASKALLIAGAILLVIAIIAIAVGIVSSTRGTIDSTENQIDSMAVRMHNNQFLQYEGIGKSLEETRELVRLIINNNNNVKNSEFIIKVRLGIHSKTADPNKYSAGVFIGPPSYWVFDESIYDINYFTGEKFSDGNAGKTFNIKLTYNSKGIIDKIDFYRRFN